MSIMVGFSRDFDPIDSVVAGQQDDLGEEMVNAKV